MSDHAGRSRLRVNDFAVGVLRFVRSLPADVASDSVIRQIARSAANVSSNYKAACRAQSRVEVVKMLGRAVDAADDTEQWLWMAGQLGLAPGPAVEQLVEESRELRADLVASASGRRVMFERR